MATTKKTAKAPLKKKASKKLAKKPRVVKAKKVAKKTAKKTVKKVVSKKIAKKSVAKKASKKVSKKITKKKVSKKKLKVVDETPNDQLLEISTHRLQLATLSSLQAPIHYGHIVAQTARVTGFAFVVIGALFAVLHVQILNTLPSSLADNFSKSQRAELCTAGTVCEELDQNTDTEPNTETDSETPNSAYEPPLIDEEPEVSFFVDRETALSDIVELKYEVNDAEYLKAVVLNKGTQEYTILGVANNIEPDVWVFNWDTTQFLDGEYKIKALVKSLAGHTYERHDSMYITVQNYEEPEPEPEPEPELAPEPAPELEQDTEVPAAAEEVEIAEEVVEEELQPEVKILVKDTGVLDGVVDVGIRVNSADVIEMYTIPNFGLTPYFAGLANDKGDGEWRFRFDTTQIPNGNHEIFARIKNDFGTYDSERLYILIFNEINPTQTFEDKVYVERVKESAAEIETINDKEFALIEDVSVETGSTEVILTADVLVPQIEAVFVGEDTLDDVALGIIQDFNASLRGILDELALAKRDGDVDTVNAIDIQIDELRQNAFNELTALRLTPELLSKINIFMEDSEGALEKLVIRNDKIISERVGDKVFDDTDTDGVSDYDEINLYGTDPFSADSDGDGFTDGAEIEGGYNPTDSSSEALVKYESPKEVGVVREDILTVDSIVTIVPDPEDRFDDGVVAQAVISGVALPNSFVTLYLFSTPVVVSVKTDNSGGWSYKFDKELEDGQHEVYVAITDNAGRIVAKSNPLSFVKTAEAFTEEDVAAAAKVVPSTTVEPTIISENIFLLALSVIVVALGLVLILLGIHIQGGRRSVVSQ